MRPMLVSTWEKALADATNSFFFFLSQVGIFWASLTISVAMPKHLMRSKLTIVTNRIEDLARRTKTKVNGIRVLFLWTCPTCVITGLGLAKVYEKVAHLHRFTGDERFGLVPDVRPERSLLHELSHFIYAPMSRARFSRLTSDFCKGAGIPSELTTHASGLYAGRRTLQTSADLERYTDSERLDVGGWFSNTAKAHAATPRRYSATRLFLFYTHSAP